MNTINWNTARLESKLVWQYLNVTFNPTVIVPFVYSGAIAAHELLTYAATKLYFAISVEFSHYTVVPATNCVAYDNANVQKSAWFNSSMTYDSVAAVVKYGSIYIQLHDTWFSRVVTSYSYVNFIGYKLTY